MPVRTRPVRRSPIRLLAVVGCAALVTVGCGGDDDDRSSATVATTAAAGGGAAGAPDPGESAPADVDDAENPVLLGLQVSGPTGASVEIEAVAYHDGQAQQPMDLVATVRDDPWYFLFSTFIESAEVTVGSGTGGTVTVEAVRGRANDPENPMAGIEVMEVLETVEVTEGDTATLQLP